MVKTFVMDTTEINKNREAETPAFLYPLLNAVKGGAPKIVCKKCGIILLKPRAKKRKVCPKCEWEFYIKGKKKKYHYDRSEYKKSYYQINKKRENEKKKLWRKTDAGKIYLQNQYLKHKHKIKIYRENYYKKCNGIAIIEKTKFILNS